jgi:hypothetical protein
MPKFFKKISVLALIFAVSVNLAPLALAESNPLDIIKEKLATGENKIEVIDYSENVWGRLPERVYKALEDAGYESFAKMYENLNSKAYLGVGPFTSETDFTIKDFYNGKCMGENGKAKKECEKCTGKTGEEKKQCEKDNTSKLQEAINNLRAELSAVKYKFKDKDDNEQEIYLSNDDINLIIDEIFASQSAGERQLRDIVRDVVVVMRNLVGGLAIIWIIISGIRMVLAGGDESAISEQRRSITYAFVGLIIILLLERLIDIIYGPAGVVRTELTAEATAAFSVEVYSLISYIKAIIGTIAILMIVVSGLRTIFTYGEEEGITKQRKAILWIGIGLILLFVNKAIIEQIFIMPVQTHDQISASNVTAIINTFGQVMQFILGFVGLIALGTLVYGAGFMLINYGNEELVKESKKIIKNAIIGIIVIISAYTIVATLVVFK